MISQAPDPGIWRDEQRRQALEQLGQLELSPVRGRISKVLGLLLEASGLHAQTGHSCKILCASGEEIEAEVVGFRNQRALLMPVGFTRGIAPGDPVSSLNQSATIQVSDSLLGHVIDAHGKPMDGKEIAKTGPEMPLHGYPLNPMARHIIDTTMQLGVRALDACVTMGWGQRIGLFAGTGVGKSVLLGMLTRNTDAGVIVIALVGERGREVREFLDYSLGHKALERCVVVVATSDMPPMLRVRAALMATSIAEYFCNQGKKVLLLMDSLTRFIQAQREIGLVLGEPPTSKGYTPSCFSSLASLLERAGPGAKGGDISALYTVLVEGDDLADPVADAALSVLDGHVVLDRTLAERGHYPAINILKSISRLAINLNPEPVRNAARSLRKEYALYERMEDMVNMGAYKAGSNPMLDQVIKRLPAIEAFLQQDQHEKSSLREAGDRIIGLMDKS